MREDKQSQTAEDLRLALSRFDLQQASALARKMDWPAFQKQQIGGTGSVLMAMGMAASSPAYPHAAMFARRAIKALANASACTLH